MGLSHPRYVLWAAQDGRADDLVFHLHSSGKGALKAHSNCPKRRAPLHLAAIGGHVRCIRLLCEAGSSLNSQDKDGHTPLHLATAHQHLHCVQLLLELGAEANVTTRFGVCPLHVAASVGSMPCAELLVGWGADVNAQESWGQTPLAIATLKGRISCMQVLLRMGADHTVRDYHHGHAPLHLACASQDEESALVLLDAGCDVHAANGAGLSPLGVALTNKFYPVVPLLLEYGARLNEADRKHTFPPLQEYLDQQTGSPRSLLQLCRVAVRQSLGEYPLGDPPSLGLPQHLQDFVGCMLELCRGDEVRTKALEGGAFTLLHSLSFGPEQPPSVQQQALESNAVF